VTDIERLRMELDAAINITRRLTAEIERLTADNARLRAEIARLKSETLTLEQQQWWI
jgi:cell division protein FtsB